MSRVLVVANETVEAEELLAELRRIEGEQPSTFLVVAPAVAAEHGLGTWSQAGAIEAAQERVDRTLALLRSEGLECDGYVGDMVPFSAVRDALDRFEATSIVISTHPATRSGWLRKDLVDQVRSTFKLPVVHVISYVRERRAV
jgi:GABA permease